MKKRITIDIDTDDKAVPIHISEDDSSGCKYRYEGETITDGVLNAFHNYIETQTDLQV